MREFGKDRQCVICGEYHRTLLQARMCCTFRPKGEGLVAKMQRLIGPESAAVGIGRPHQGLNGQILNNARILTDLKRKAAEQPPTPGPKPDRDKGE